MKVAVIGCGTIANAAHIPSYMKNPEAEIKYFCDIIPERAQAAVEKYGCGTAVWITTMCWPTRRWRRLRLHAQQRPSHHHHGRSPGRKNVLCEKPAARTYGGGAGDAEGPA